MAIHTAKVVAGLVDADKLQQLRTDKAAREGRDISQAVAAVEAGIGHGTLTQLEQGRAEDARGSTLHKLAEYYGVSIEELLR